MKRVEAFQSDDGRLFMSRHDAAVDDLVEDMRRVWQKLTDMRDRGDPVVIAKLLGSEYSAEARAALIVALERFEKAEAAE